LAAYSDGKVRDAEELAVQVARGDVSDPATPLAAGLALHCAYMLYCAEREKGTSQAARVQSMAQYIIEQWPVRPEADEARMTLAEFYQRQNRSQDALALFDQVRRQSKRYAAAQLFAGQITWRMLLDERKKPDGGDPATKSRLEAAALERLIASTDSYKAVEPGADKVVDEARLLLAQIYQQLGRPKDAVALLDPLLEALGKKKPQSLEPASRLFVAAARCHLALGNIEAATNIAALMAGMSGDTAVENDSLMEVAGLLSAESRKMESSRKQLEATGSVVEARALERRQSVSDSIQLQLLENVKNRKQLSFMALLETGDLAARLGQVETARQQYERILSRSETDPDFHEQAAKGLTRVRAQLVGLLRDEKRFADAVKQVDALIEAHPKALEPRLEKARILQAWAESQPDRYPQCIEEWTAIRLMLSGLPKKPAEYYEAVAGAAECLIAQSKAAKDASKALQAEKLLKSTLTLSPELDGESTVSRFNKLLGESKGRQQRQTHSR
jgi:hypothetical protein